MRKVLWATIAIGLVAAHAAARDIYVDNAAGDDKNAGLHARTTGDTTSPVRTIAKALRLARAGDRVILANNEQPYRECLSLVGSRHSGAAPQLPFVIDGNGATLDGSAPIPVDGWQFYRDNIFRFRPPAMSHAVLFYRGQSLMPLPLPQTTAYPPRLTPMQWCALGGIIYFAVERDKLPPAYQLSYAELPTGITLYQVDQVAIRNLTIRGFQDDGVAVAQGARNVLLDNVTCTANGECGIAVRGGAQAAINACKLFENGQSQLMTFANSETHLLANEIAGDSAPPWADQGGRVYLGAKRIEGTKGELK